MTEETRIDPASEVRQLENQVRELKKVVIYFHGKCSDLRRVIRQFEDKARDDSLREEQEQIKHLKDLGCGPYSHDEEDSDA